MLMIIWDIVNYSVLNTLYYKVYSFKSIIILKFSIISYQNYEVWYFVIFWKIGFI